jgi:predicted NAD/FAD-binding protein
LRSYPGGKIMTAEAQKIAVLGGGVGSITAAYWLTSQPGWQERYQVTVYQQGWRLGGKGEAPDGMYKQAQANRNLRLPARAA